MSSTGLHRAFAPLKRWTPSWVWSPIRKFGTAILAPARFSIGRGHFRSSIAAKAVDRQGRPLPWYCYPAIDFLDSRSFRDKTVLEFGAGQSTLWWARRAQHVVSIEGDAAWYRKVMNHLPMNVKLFKAAITGPESLADVERILSSLPVKQFDVVIIDGLDRDRLAPLALRVMAPDGFILCDNFNAKVYRLREAFLSSGLNRVDFIGMVPGVILEQATSIYFGPSCFAFTASQPTPIAFSGEAD